MATDTLTAVPASANSAEALDGLARDISQEVSRIKSLARAADDALDDMHGAGNDELRIAAMDRAIDFLRLIEEANENLRRCGEAIETVAINAKLAAMAARQ